MELIDMMRSGDVNALVVIFGVFGFIVFSILLSVASYLTAESKQRNKVLAFLFGLLPAVNIIVLIYYLCVPKKLDE